MKKDQTKRLLLRAVHDLVKEKGCIKMTLNDIMERTKLSKGAIYHYVKSKDELLGLVLMEKLNETNDRFFAKVSEGKKQLQEPLDEITQNVSFIEEPSEVTNQIFIYLLSRQDNPQVKKILKQFYEFNINLSKNWIHSGQENGVIDPSIHAQKTAELFVLIAYGLRARSAITDSSFEFTANDYIKFMEKTLKRGEG
ncbi:TetR/AcrR family transcriptional regulator [Bacillus carboniphilus]|uniref:TetR/AcrR family transcriptional regulator n=1 Tax=Bacillus carboniphilus TaxID=86663 RepID=A0ABY9JXY3_9BACI|nr:TetR/AcrR family transcriptional regulator [Bacillus carboniphilus]WLR44246.1 TetR/AcrR family transcriptional regulator [Bacillus carboniphilus]